jgi:hypothetical protein
MGSPISLSLASFCGIGEKVHLDLQPHGLPTIE